MTKRKVCFILGTRPEAIKLCPVVLAFKTEGSFDCKVCVTGQHREMLNQVLEVFGVVPDKDLARLWISLSVSQKNWQAGNLQKK